MAMGTNEQGFITGAASGAAAGAMVGGPWGAAAGFVIGGAIGYMQADSQRMAAKRAAKAQEKTRRDSVIRELNARDQADSLAFAGLSNTNRSGGNQPEGVVGAQGQPGTIASNISSSGTF